MRSSQSGSLPVVGHREFFRLLRRRCRRFRRCTNGVFCVRFFGGAGCRLGGGGVLTVFVRPLPFHQRLAAVLGVFLHTLFALPLAIGRVTGHVVC